MHTTPERTESGVGETSTATQRLDLILNSKFIDELLAELDKAKSSVLICAYSWRWYDLEPELQIQKFNTKLLQKLQQGLNVQIIVDSSVDARKFKALGFKVITVDRDKTLHAKAVCFDYKMLALGSHNLTKHGTMDNYETTIFSDDPNLIIQFIDYFYKLWDTYG